MGRDLFDLYHVLLFCSCNEQHDLNDRDWNWKNPNFRYSPKRSGMRENVVVVVFFFFQTVLKLLNPDTLDLIAWMQLQCLFIVSGTQTMQKI